MNKQLLLLVFAGLSLSAVHAQKPTVILGGEELTVDTLFHAKSAPAPQTQLHLSAPILWTSTALLSTAPLPV